LRDWSGQGHVAPANTKKPKPKRKLYATLEDATQGIIEYLGAVRIDDDYCYDDGVYIVRVIMPDGSKEVRPVTKTVAGWVIALDGLQGRLRPLYRHQDIEPGDTCVVVCEGEKTANALRRVGIKAVNPMMGANMQANKSDWAPLNGLHVVIAPDNDKAGSDYANAVANHLANTAASVRIMEPITEFGSHGDLADLIGALEGKGQGAEEIAADIEELIAAAQPFEPAAAHETNGAPDHDNAPIPEPDAGTAVAVVGDEDEFTDEPEPAPKMGEAAFRGVLGEIVAKADPETEADPAAVLMHLLVMVGNMMDGVHFDAGATKNHTNLFGLVIGDTAEGRKGMSLDSAWKALGYSGAGDVPVDGTYSIADNKVSGLGSAEGMIDQLADMVKTRDKDGEMVTNSRTIGDHRRIIVETELSNVLAVQKREGSKLGELIRDLFDSRAASVITKGHVLHASRTHVSIIGHITPPELKTKLDSVDIFNGWLNRFLLCESHQSKELPFGGKFRELDFSAERQRVTGAINKHRSAVHACWV
jgi:5S rRNA maturation endonuclease (ribonuclease M5)